MLSHIISKYVKPTINKHKNHPNLSSVIFPYNKIIFFFSFKFCGNIWLVKSNPYIIRIRNLGKPQLKQQRKLKKVLTKK